MEGLFLQIIGDTKLALPDFVLLSDPAFQTPYRGIHDRIPELKAIRLAVKSLHDLMDLRIRTGHRIVSHAAAKLGISRGSGVFEGIPHASKLMERMKQDYETLTEAVVSPKGAKSVALFRDRAKALVESFNQRLEEKGLDEVDRKEVVKDKYSWDSVPLVLSDYTEYALVHMYEQYLAHEKIQEQVLFQSIQGLPIWKDFLAYVKGVGPRMAGVMVSYLDPCKSVYPSSFVKYCGLDVVRSPVGDDSGKFLRYMARKFGEEVGALFLKADSIMKDSGDLDEIISVYDQAAELVKPEMKGSLQYYQNQAITRWREVGVGRNRSKDHLVPRTRPSRDGLVDFQSLSYNPFVKSRLVGTLAAVMIMSKSQYKEVHDNYLHRLNTDPVHKFKMTEHKKRMAARYMIKAFLCDLHTVWRKQLGLIVVPSYSEEKQGLIHSNNPMWKSIVPPEIQKSWPPSANLTIFNQIKSGRR